MRDWPKHPKKEYEDLLREAGDQNWKIWKGNGYYRAQCPCGKHSKSIPITPSVSRTLLNLRKWFYRQPCWGKDE